MKSDTHYQIVQIAARLSALPQNHLSYRLRLKLLALGAVLPDYGINQFLHPHFYETSACYVLCGLGRMLQKERPLRRALRLGMFLHYLGDFCCKVHRSGSVYPLSDHMLYEIRQSSYWKKHRIQIEKQAENLLRSAPERPALRIDSVLRQYLEEDAQAPVAYERDLTHAVTVSALLLQLCAVQSSPANSSVDK